MDAAKISADTITRGGLDWSLGPEAQASTRQARERMPDWAEAPIDVASQLAASPYQVGGMLAGAGYGGLEGGVSAYLHQPNWIPTAEDQQKIAGETAKGAVLGSVGTKAGEWAGKGISAPTGSNMLNTAPQGVLSKLGDYVKPLADMSLTNAMLADAIGLGGVATGAKTFAKGLNWLGNTRFANPAMMANPAITD